MIILRYVSVIKISKAKIEENIKQQRVIKNYGVFTVTNVPNLTLHFWLHKNRPERFN